MLKSSDTVRTLVAAKDAINHPDKWCKYKLHKGDGPTYASCLRGAVMDAIAGKQHSMWNTTYTYTRERTEESICGAILVLFPIRAKDCDDIVSAFNNHYSTTHADVMAVLDYAISIHQRRHSHAIRRHTRSA